jgi:hypothetical protein
MSVGYAWTNTFLAVSVSVRAYPAVIMAALRMPSPSVQPTVVIDHLAAARTWARERYVRIKADAGLYAEHLRRVRDMHAAARPTAQTGSGSRGSWSRGKVPQEKARASPRKIHSVGIVLVFPQLCCNDCKHQAKESEGKSDEISGDSTVSSSSI